MIHISFCFSNITPTILSKNYCVTQRSFIISQMFSPCMYITFDINSNNIKMAVLFLELMIHTLLPLWSLPKEIRFTSRPLNMKIKLGPEKTFWLTSTQTKVQQTITRNPEKFSHYRYISGVGIRQAFNEKLLNE